VVLQLGLWSFAIRAAGAHQTRTTLTFQLDNNRAYVNTLRASHDDSTTYLIEVCEGYISRLVQDDRGLHRCTGRPWRRDRRVGVILVHVNEPLAICPFFQLCVMLIGCCGRQRRFGEGGKELEVVGRNKKSLGVGGWWEFLFNLGSWAASTAVTNSLQRLVNVGSVRDNI